MVETPGLSSVPFESPHVSQKESGDPARSRSEERCCTVAIDEKYSPHEVQLNMDLLGGFNGLVAGSLMSITVLPDPEKPTGAHGTQKTPAADHVGSSAATGGGALAGHGYTYVFVARDFSKDARARFPTAEVLVNKRVAGSFGMKKGSQVMLRPVRTSLSPF